MNEQPKYYRLLQVGEIVQEGDVAIHADDGLKRLDPVYPHTVGRPYKHPNDIFRLVQVDEWIECAKQKPTPQDFRPTGHIDALGESGKPYTLSESPYNTYRITHWRRITPPTPAEPPIKIKEHVVVFNPDKSVTVGCTKVPAETMEKIIERYTKA